MQHGTGKDILFVHGWASSERMWNNVIPMISDNYCCWAIDLPGNGASLLSGDQIPSIELYAQSVLDFCAEKQLHPDAIIAHSMGGMVILKALAQHPYLTDKLMLIAPVITGKMTIAGSLVRRLVKTQLGIAVLKNSRSIWNTMKITPLNYLAATPIYAGAEVAKQAREDFVRCHWKAITHSLISIAHEDLTPILPDIRQQTTIIVGARDYTVPPSESQVAAANIPNVDLHIYDNNYHLPHDESSERFEQDLLTFLS